MKKLLLAAAIFAAINVQAQTKDTTVQITLNINQLRAVLAAIDANIDSKRASKELIDFLQQNAKIVNPVTDWNKKAQDVNKALDGTKTNYGVIAQELKTILPDLVGGMYGGKYLGVNYEQLISILIAAVQELNKKMEGITCR